MQARCGAQSTLGKKFSTELQVRHMSSLKGTLGVKRATINWAVSGECGHVPLQFYWFKSMVKMYNGLLNSNIETLRKILDGFQGSRRCESFVVAKKQGTPVSMQDFTDDLRHRLRDVWRDVEGVDPRETNDKLATYQALFALPSNHNMRKPIQLPRRLHLDLPQHVMQNVSQFRLRPQTLNVETASWEDGYEGICALRRKYFKLFQTLPGDFPLAQHFLRQQLSVQA
eukprot:1138117-Pelagomonas_calceolata.AAC.2